MMTVVFLLLCFTVIIAILAWTVYLAGPPDTDDALEQAHKKLVAQWGTPIEAVPRYRPSPLEVAQSVHHSFEQDWTTSEQFAFIVELCKSPMISDQLKVNIIHSEVRKAGYEITPNKPESLDKEIDHE